MLVTTVMLMETTGALELIVPLVITVFVAKINASKTQSQPATLAELCALGDFE